MFLQGQTACWVISWIKVIIREGLEDSFQDKLQGAVAAEVGTGWRRPALQVPWFICQPVSVPLNATRQDDFSAVLLFQPSTPAHCSLEYLAFQIYWWRSNLMNQGLPGFIEMCGNIHHYQEFYILPWDFLSAFKDSLLNLPWVAQNHYSNFKGKALRWCYVAVFISLNS